MTVNDVKHLRTTPRGTNPKSAPRFDLTRAYITASAVLSAFMILIIVGILMFQSGSALFIAGPSLLGTTWDPSQNLYGIVPMIFGSVIVMVIAMSLALPIGILAAFYIAETRSHRLRQIAKSALEVLAGIPSIIYGLIGVAFVSVWVADIFALQTGRLILTAGLLLAVMILPTIISLSEDAISNVSTQYRENAYALGLYRFEVITNAIAPIAKADIAGAALLALGRALGETMAVMLVIGSLDRLPTPLFILMSLILVMLTLGLTAMSHFLFKREIRHA